MSHIASKKANHTVSVEGPLRVLQTGNSKHPTRFSSRKRQRVNTPQHYSDSDLSDDEREKQERPRYKRNKAKSHRKSKMYGTPMNNEYDSSQQHQKKQDRQLMRPWLIEQVDQGDIPGLTWLDNNRSLIKIPWTHASRHGWDETKDSDLFRRWAKHTGKYSSDPKDKSEDGNPKKWKANFRCAMNSLPDIKEEKEMSQKKGSEAFKVYRLLEEKARGQCKKKRTNSESSDSDMHYKKYITKADRLERHKTVLVKDRIRQTIQERQAFKTEPVSPVQIYPEQNNIRQPQIPVPVTETHNMQYCSPHYNPYSSDSDEMTHQICGGSAQRYTKTQSVEKEIEVTTSTLESAFYDPKDYTRYEHSYTNNSGSANIPSIVADMVETEHDSDYGSSASPGNQEEKVAQVISELEDEYPGDTISQMSNSFHMPNSNLSQEPMFFGQNNIYKRSESMELYAVPGNSFDQSFPMTPDMHTPCSIQMDTDQPMDRILQFQEC